MPTGNKYQRPITARRVNADAVISLLKRREWYSDDGGTGDDPDDGGTGDNDPGGSGNDELTTLRAKAEADRITIATLKNENMKKSQSVQTAESAAQEAEEARLIAIGEHETVISNLRTENESLKARAEIGDNAILEVTAANQLRFDATPEALRYQVPVKYPPLELSKWWAEHGDNVKMPNAPDHDAGAGGGQSGSGGSNGKSIKLTADEKEAADKLGMTHEQYYDNRPKAME